MQIEKLSCHGFHILQRILSWRTNSFIPWNVLFWFLRTFFCHSLKHSHTIPWNVLIPFLAEMILDRGNQRSNSKNFPPKILRPPVLYNGTIEEDIITSHDILHLFLLSFFLQWVVLISFLVLVPLNSMATWSALGSGAVTLVSYLMTWNELNWFVYYAAV